MEDFVPEPKRYSLIWIQWCIIYLTDEDLVQFLKNCAQNLAPGGVLCIKDNICRQGFVVDKDDSSITRSDRYLQDLLKQAGLTTICTETQPDFPQHLFRVKMYALTSTLSENPK